MITRLKQLFALLLLTATLPLNAQEGHPLSGTWQGEWGNGQFLTMILTWDGKAITGTTNPGPASMDIGTVVLDSKLWTVSIETDLKDDAGKTTHFSATGRLDNIGSPLRTLTLQYHSGKEEGTFVLSRQGGA